MDSQAAADSVDRLRDDERPDGESRDGKAVSGSVETVLQPGAQLLFLPCGCHGVSHWGDAGGCRVAGVRLQLLRRGHIAAHGRAPGESRVRLSLSLWVVAGSSVQTPDAKAEIALETADLPEVLPAYCEYICPAGTLEGGIPLLLLHPELRQAAGALLAWKLGILLLTLLGCVTIARFFCKALCPLGAVYGLMNRFSVCHLRVERERCISCGRCQRACPMEIHPVVSPESPECIRCGNCAAQCPRQAIRLAFSASPPCPSSELPHH